MQAIEDCEKKLQGRGRVLVRYSGTEPLCRVMIEGENAEEINAMAQSLVETIQKNVG